MRSYRDSIRRYVAVELAIVAAVVVFVAVIVFPLLPVAILAEIGLEGLGDGNGHVFIVLALVLLAILVPLGFHVAFGRLLRRGEHGAGTIERIREDISEQFRRRKPAGEMRPEDRAHRVR